jgi:hypothetical protein
MESRQKQQAPVSGWLTGALKSSPPPELILENTITVTITLGYVTLVIPNSDLPADYPAARRPACWFV